MIALRGLFLKVFLTSPSKQDNERPASSCGIHDPVDESESFLPLSAVDDACRAPSCRLATKPRDRLVDIEALASTLLGGKVPSLWPKGAYQLMPAGDLLLPAADDDFGEL